jgi:peroxiredoxin Q/BCP
VFGISRDTIASHCKFIDKYGLTFPLLSDEGTTMMAAYGAWGDKLMYGKKVTGIIRSTVLVDKDGNVARVWPRVQAKGHAAAVLDAVKALGNGGGGTVTTAAAPAKKAKAKAPAKKKAAATKAPAKKKAAPKKKAAATKPAKKAAKKKR